MFNSHSEASVHPLQLIVQINYLTVDERLVLKSVQVQRLLARSLRLGSDLVMDKQKTSLSMSPLVQPDPCMINTTTIGDSKSGGTYMDLNVA